MERQTVSTAQRTSSHNSPLQKHSAATPAAQHPMLALQRSIGNRAVQRLIQSRYIQAKLQVGAPGDQYEQEADRVADTVMRMPDPHLSSAATVSNRTQISRVHRKCTECEEEMQRQPVEEEEEIVQGKWSAGQTPVIQRMCSECQNKVQRQPLEDEESPLEKQPGEEEGMLQGKAEGGEGFEVAPKLETQIAGLRGGGQPLPESVRAHFEPRFGHDFSGVRLHTGAQAAQLARSINAHAFTVGRDVAFGAGQYSPDTSGGQRLLAHELTHVVQQGGAAQTSTGSEQVQTATVQTKANSSGSDLIQRAGDPAAIPTDLRCPPDLTTGAPAGTSALFATGQSSITPTHTALLTTFRNEWQAAGGTDNVLVHGYASTSGDQGPNWTLSCSRALSVQTELIRLGIPAARISVVAHGESTDFPGGVAANQRAVATRTPAPPPPPPPPPPPVPVTITGNSELWHFDGETPTAYPLQQTLTGNAGGTAGTFRWSMTGGDAFADFSGSNTAVGPSVVLRSKLGSGALNDVGVRVDFTATGGGTGTASRQFTVQRPDRLNFIRNDDNVDPTFVYETRIFKRVLDQFGTELPRNVEVNEQFTAAPTADFPGMNWRRGPNAGGVIGPPAWLFDIIGGETPGHTPEPVVPTHPNAGTKVYHWPGIWRIGSSVVGRGRNVAAVTWQKHRGFARHV